MFGFKGSWLKQLVKLASIEIVFLCWTLPTLILRASYEKISLEKVSFWRSFWCPNNPSNSSTASKIASTKTMANISVSFLCVKKSSSSIVAEIFRWIWSMWLRGIHLLNSMWWSMGMNLAGKFAWLSLAFKPSWSCFMMCSWDWVSFVVVLFCLIWEMREFSKIWILNFLFNL